MYTDNESRSYIHMLVFPHFQQEPILQPEVTVLNPETREAMVKTQ